MIEVREVTTRKEQKQFVNFPLQMYKNNPYFVPPLYSDEMALFKKNYTYYDQCEAVYYNAYKDGVMVGRISGILQKASNEKWNQKRVRFTRFDSIDDQEVATALFNKVEQWAAQKGMHEVVGPLGFSDLEREGLLIEGFDYLSTFEEQYNYRYYQKLIENCGYGKDVDWIEHRLFRLKEDNGRMKRLTDLMMRRYELHFDNSKSTAKFIKQYADTLFSLIDETYEKIYGTVPLSPKMRKMLVNNFRMIVDIKYISVIADKNDRLVGFGICFPSIGEAVQKSGGRLTPLTLLRILRCLKHPKTLDMALIGIIDEYKNKGIAPALIYNFATQMQGNGIEAAETNLNLEENYAIHNMWKSFDHIQHKRRRSFVKRIVDEPVQNDEPIDDTTTTTITE